jgi:hypothetical protein
MDRSHRFLLGVVFFLSTGCEETSVVGAQANKAVTFIVPIEASRFTEQATLVARLWNAEQLKALAKNADCSVSYDPVTQTEEMNCPEGVEYQAVTPEEFKFPIRDVAARIEVTSGTIRVGEKFRILLSGLNHDKCNTTSADLVATADSEEVVLESLVWETTMKACP